MKSSLAVEKESFVSRDNLFEDMGFSPEEAGELEIKAAILKEIVRNIRRRRLTQVKIGVALGIHQPDVSKLMSGRIYNFSVGKLLRLAGKLDLQATVTLHEKKAARPVNLRAKPRREAIAA